ncbi:MAG: DinB family protein [Asgard group archaeon]|nr:DinB family protein [Asgard group archaeon]
MTIKKETSTGCCPSKLAKTNSKDFLAKQLDETAQIFDWAMRLVPEERLLETPPHASHPNASDDVKRYFGSWSAYRIFFHLIHYEETAALPNMTLWLDESQHIDRKCGGETIAYKEALEKRIDLKTLLDRFHNVRDKQIEVLNKIPEDQWTEKKSNTNWGSVTLEFIVTKSIQHTLEHGNKILRNALFWDSYLSRLERS